MSGPALFSDHLRIERVLGRGGMATVYLARDLREDRLVALKVLHPELGAALGPGRFQREIQVTARLDHPGVLPVLESGQAVVGPEVLPLSESPTAHERPPTPLLYYTMPYVDGGSLRSRLEREGQLGIAEAVRIAREVARALDHAHRRGVVHRDVKPENILLSGDRVLVADFGIAKLLSEGDTAKLTETGLSVGTPAYMSPEQGAADPRVDGRADVYALGCVLYELLAGQPPFTGPSPQAVLARHALDPVPSLRTVRSTVPPALEAAIARAMAKVPADRFESAAKFAAALAGDGSAASATGAAATAPSFASFARRPRWPSVALLAAGVAGAAGWVLLRSPRPSVTPTAAVMAVLPFEPADADTALARLGRDLASTVSASLDGVGEIRTVDRLTVLAQLHDRREPLSLREAGRLGLRYGATSVVAGSVAHDGPRVRLDVGLYSTDSLKPLLRAVVTGAPDSLSALTDSVTWRVLAEVWRRGRPPTPTLEAITTRSVEALRAYLDGEEASIAGRHADAQAAYARAIAADSTFWYAYFRAAAASGWWEGEADSATVRTYRAHADRLPRRERLLIQAWTWDSGLVWQRDRLEALVREYPDYWPAWFMLGDSYTHYYPYVGWPLDEARRTLERVVALNPRMVYAWGHMVWMYQTERDTVATAHALDALERLGARQTFVENERMDQLLLWRTIQALQTERTAAGPLLDSLYQFAIASSRSDGAYILRFALCVASPAAQIQFTERLLRHGLPRAEADDFLRFEALMWAARGAWDSALATSDRDSGSDPEDPPGLRGYRLAVLGTWLGAIPPSQAQARRASAATALAAAPAELAVPFRAELAWLDGIVAVTRKDAPALAAARAAVTAAGDTSVGRAQLVDLAPFELALRGNRPEAGARLASLEMEAANRDPWATMVSHPLRRAVNRTAAAEWLLEAGDTARAIRLLAYHQAFSGPFLEKFPLRPLLTLRLARIEEAQGRRAEAERDYRSFLVWYDLPSPAHRHLVEEARIALARLSGGGSRPAGR